MPKCTVSWVSWIFGAFKISRKSMHCMLGKKPERISNVCSYLHFQGCQCFIIVSMLHFEQSFQVDMVAL